ncbi:MAG: 3-methyl-2-oxobutanoate hydroxymethyltransferase [candidate division Zixibacteria bacterium]|nr:3-methyl-2-oxobutanoate hydroxymethyltransferase [candidate division Zixibacteria bacterium]
MSVVKKRDKVTVNTITRMKSRNEKIAVLTAYDYFTARLLDQAGIDILLVGDSAANVIHGHTSTLPIGMDIMIGHTAAVSRGREKALVVADMPFLSYQPSLETAIRNAGRFLAEGDAEAVKIEGGIEMKATAKRLIECGIPVMGHVGLTPQSINRIGGPKVQGKTDASRGYLMESALALEEAGCFSIVLELMASETAAEITSALKTTATIGIGAGPHCDGQVLVINDILGLREPGFKPRFLREYADLPPIISDAARRFIEDVRSGSYPSDDESFGSSKL